MMPWLILSVRSSVHMQGAIFLGGRIGIHKVPYEPYCKLVEVKIHLYMFVTMIPIFKKQWINTSEHLC